MSDLEKFIREYGGYWGAHPNHTPTQWAHEVANNDTRVGYWEWAYAHCNNDVPKNYPESRVIPNKMTIDEIVEILTIRCRTAQPTPAQAIRLVELEARFFGADVVDEVIGLLKITSNHHIREAAFNWLADKSRKGLNQ